MSAPFGEAATIPAPGEELDTRTLALQSPAGFAYHCSGREYILAAHLLFLNDLLVKVATGEIKRLIISMPPRHGKSWLTSRYFPAWYLGLFPNRRVMMVGHGKSFAEEWGGAARDELAEHGPALFGVAPQRNSAAGRWAVVDKHGRATGGGMQSCGVGGDIMGRGADLLLIDDPIKNDEEAHSPTYRNKLFRFFNSSAISRLNSMSGAVVITMTRWHHDDLAGQLITQDKEGVGEGWVVVNLPAICDSDDDPMGRKRGEALWPEMWNAEWMAHQKVARGSWVWGSLFQGKPTPLTGGLFKKAWVRHWRWVARGSVLTYLQGNRLVRVSVSDLILFATVDLACTTEEQNDYTVAMVFGLCPDGTLLVMDVWREKLEGPDIVPMLERLDRGWDLDGIWIESVQFQLALVQEARRAGLPAKALKPKKNKVARAIPATAAMEGARILFLADAPWLEELLEEMFGFPLAKFKDQVDCLAYGEQVAGRLRRGGGGGGSKASVGGAGGGRIPKQQRRARDTNNGAALSRHQLRRQKAARKGVRK